MSSSLFMPTRNDPSAPQFNGQAAYLAAYLDHVEQLAQACSLTQHQTIRSAIRYTPSETYELWSSLDNAQGDDWSAFKTELFSYYPESTGDHRYTLSSLELLVETQAHSPITTLDEFGEYLRSFFVVSHYMQQRNRLSNRETSSYFLSGLHTSLRNLVRQQLRLENPRHHPDDPFTMNQIRDAALFVLSSSEIDPFANVTFTAQNTQDLQAQPVSDAANAPSISPISKSISDTLKLDLCPQTRFIPQDNYITHEHYLSSTLSHSIGSYSAHIDSHHPAPSEHLESSSKPCDSLNYSSPSLSVALEPVVIDSHHPAPFNHLVSSSKTTNTGLPSYAIVKPTETNAEQPIVKAFIDSAFHTPFHLISNDAEFKQQNIDSQPTFHSNELDLADTFIASSYPDDLSSKQSPPLPEIETVCVLMAENEACAFNDFLPSDDDLGSLNSSSHRFSPTSAAPQNDDISSSDPKPPSIELEPDHSSDSPLATNITERRLSISESAQIICDTPFDPGTLPCAEEIDMKFNSSYNFVTLSNPPNCSAPTPSISQNDDVATSNSELSSASSKLKLYLLDASPSPTSTTERLLSIAETAKIVSGASFDPGPLPYAEDVGLTSNPRCNVISDCPFDECIPPTIDQNIAHSSCLPTHYFALADTFIASSELDHPLPSSISSDLNTVYIPTSIDSANVSVEIATNETSADADYQVMSLLTDLLNDSNARKATSHTHDINSDSTSLSSDVSRSPQSGQPTVYIAYTLSGPPGTLRTTSNGLVDRLLCLLCEILSIVAFIYLAYSVASLGLGAQTIPKRLFSVQLTYFPIAHIIYPDPFPPLFRSLSFLLCLFALLSWLPLSPIYLLTWKSAFEVPGRCRVSTLPTAGNTLFRHSYDQTMSKATIISMLGNGLHAWPK